MADSRRHTAPNLITSRTINAAILASAKLAASLSTFIAVFVLVRLLPKQDFATYNQTLLVPSVIVPLISFGIPMAILQVLPRPDTDQRRLFMGAMSILALAALGAAAVFAFMGNRLIAEWFNNPRLQQTLLWIAPFLLAQLLLPTIMKALVAAEQPARAAMLTLTFQLGTSCAAIVGALYTASYTGPIIFTLIICGGFAFVAPLYAMRVLRRQSGTHLKSCGIRQLLRVGAPLSLASATGLMHRHLDKLVVSSILSPAEYASYAVAAKELPLVDIVASTSTTVAIPDLSRLLDAGRKTEVLHLWHRMCSGMAAILMPSFVYLFTVAEFFIHTVYTKEYAAALLPFRLYLCILPARVVIYNALFVASGNSHLTLSRTVVALGLNLVLNVTLTSWMGYIGATIATLLVVYGFSTPFGIFYVSRILDVRLSETLPFGSIAHEFFKALFIPVLVVPLLLLPLSEELILLLSTVPFTVFLIFNNRDLAQHIFSRVRGKGYAYKTM